MPDRDRARPATGTEPGPHAVACGGRRRRGEQPGSTRPPGWRTAPPPARRAQPRPPRTGQSGTTPPACAPRTTSHVASGRPRSTRLGAMGTGSAHRPPRTLPSAPGSHSSTGASPSRLAPPAGIDGHPAGRRCPCPSPSPSQRDDVTVSETSGASAGHSPTRDDDRAALACPRDQPARVGAHARDRPARTKTRSKPSTRVATTVAHASPLGLGHERPAARTPHRARRCRAAERGQAHGRHPRARLRCARSQRQRQRRRTTTAPTRRGDPHDRASPQRAPRHQGFERGQHRQAPLSGQGDRAQPLGELLHLTSIERMFGTVKRRCCPGVRGRGRGLRWPRRRARPRRRRPRPRRQTPSVCASRPHRR